MRTTEIAVRLGIGGTLLFGGCGLTAVGLSRLQHTESPQTYDLGESSETQLDFPSLTFPVDAPHNVSLSNGTLTVDYRESIDFLNRYTLLPDKTGYNKERIYVPLNYIPTLLDHFPHIPDGTIQGRIPEHFPYGTEFSAIEYFVPFENGLLTDGIIEVNQKTSRDDKYGQYIMYVRQGDTITRLTPDEETVNKAVPIKISYAGVHRSFYYTQYGHDIHLVPLDGAGIYTLTLDLPQENDKFLDMLDVRIDEEGEAEILMAENSVGSHRVLVSGDGWTEELPPPPQLFNNALAEFQFFFSDNGEVINTEMQTDEHSNVTNIAIHIERNGSWVTEVYTFFGGLRDIESIVPMGENIGILWVDRSYTSKTVTVTPHLIIVPSP